MDTNNKEIGRFCSVAKKGTIILPKKIRGYRSPEGQVLEYDGQNIVFNYTPIEYNIEYNFNGGTAPMPELYKKTYTVEDSTYIPPTPVREGFIFNGWEPASILQGSIDNVRFIAKWKPNAILLDGPTLNAKLKDYCRRMEECIVTIRLGAVEDSKINISSTSTPIYASIKNSIMTISSNYHIYCNQDMRNAFSGFNCLANIDGLKYLICKDGTDISGIFNGCKLLSDVSPLESWTCNFSDFRDAFKNTSALETRRVPTWYRWEEHIKYVSTTGVIINSSDAYLVPGEKIYPEGIRGYKSITPSIIINDPEKVYVFEYEPIEYDINYSLNGGEILNPKTSYTVEDETYYPPEAIKSGFKFHHYEPECIEEGSTGNVTFIANYTV